jgi:hypothetical protein
MDTPRAFKKRRLNDALHKPFKSPLRTPLKQTSDPLDASNPSSTSLTLSKPPSETSKLSRNASTGSKSSHERRISPDHATALHSPSSTNNAGAKARDDDPTTVTSVRIIIAQNKALERQIIQLRQDTDSLTQASSILRANKAAELEGLAEKWKGAARLAAEEIFASARDRVNGMGGVGAWREQERERSQRRREYFGHEMGDGRGDWEDVDGEDAENREHRNGKWPERSEYDFQNVEWEGRESNKHDEEEEKHQDDEVSLGSFSLLVLLIVIRLSPWI